MATGKRKERLEQSIKDELSVCLRSVKDPRLQTAAVISVNHVDLAGDTSRCYIYVSCLPDDDTTMARVQEGLNSASLYLRKQISQRIRMAKTPLLIFRPDDGPKFRKRLETLVDP